MYKMAEDSNNESGQEPLVKEKSETSNNLGGPLRLPYIE